MSWGFVPDKGDAVMTEVVVTGKDLTKRFEQIAERTKTRERDALLGELSGGVGSGLAAAQTLQMLGEQAGVEGIGMVPVHPAPLFHGKVPVVAVLHGVMQHLHVRCRRPHDLLLGVAAFLRIGGQFRL